MGKVTLTASEGLFTADAATACTATTDGNAATVTGATSTSTAADYCIGTTTVCDGSVAAKNILTVTMGATLTAAKVAVITCTDNLAANGATAGAVTFSIETSTDIGKLGAQTGYPLTAPVASSSAAANSTTASAAAATGTETTVTQEYTFASITAAQYTGDMKSNCECAYANTVEAATTPTWCVATTSAYTYKSGVAMSSSAARRAAKVTFVLKVKSSVKSTTQLRTMVASGSTATKFAAALAAVNTASNKTVAPGAATVATATFAGGSSSASTLLPSMLSLVAAIFV